MCFPSRATATSVAVRTLARVNGNSRPHVAAPFTTEGDKSWSGAGLMRFLDFFPFSFFPIDDPEPGRIVPPVSAVSMIPEMSSSPAGSRWP